MNSKLQLRDLWTVLTPEEIKDGCRCLLEPEEKSGEKTRGQSGQRKQKQKKWNRKQGEQSDLRQQQKEKRREEILEGLAKAQRFRLIFVKSRPTADNLTDLVKRIGSHEFEQFQEDVIREWLVRHHLPMLSDFLNASGIPQENGFVVDDDDRPDPSPSQFEAGIASVMARHNAREVGLYLGYLVLCGGKFFSALPLALDAKAVCIVDLLKLEQPAVAPVIVPPAEPVAPAIPEDSDAFTTLDNWLIRAAVASAFGESGALTPDQVKDLVEEVVELNAQRQHTLFHRGFLHTLFNKPLTVHFPGENEVRRLWYFTGAVFGLLRYKHKHEQVLRLLRENPDLTGQLCENWKERCGSMLLPQIHPILWEAKEFGMLQRWVKGQIVRLKPEHRANRLMQIHYDAASLVRRGQWAEAKGVLDFLDDFVRTANGLPSSFPDWFLPANDRKRAQVLQLKGDFRGAEALLRPLSEGGVIKDAGKVLCDRALITAGFRSLMAVLPGKEEQNGWAMIVALKEKARHLLEEAVCKHPDSGANAHFCLGLIALQTDAASPIAADHFGSALDGMLKEERVYSEGGLIQWTRFLLGLALLEKTETADLQHARDYIEQSIQAPIVFPLWLWSRAMQASALFNDKTLGQQIAEHLLRNRGSDAYRVIWDSGLVVSVGSLRKTYLTWMEDASLPLHEKWESLNAMLPAALIEDDASQAEDILDAMEGMATKGGDYRAKFLELLENDRNYSPAWELEDATHCRIKFHELEGNLADAAALLRSRFFALWAARDSISIQEAAAVLERMQELRHDDADIRQLRVVLSQIEPQAAHDECPLKAGALVRVLYVGGNETQIAYEADIRLELARLYPGLKVEFYYPGWKSNWNVHLDRVRPKISQSNAVVLSRMVRTQFGRKVRAACNAGTPWFPCTGKGKQSLKRSIESAALWAANKKG